MQKFELALDKYLVTQSGYFWLATAMESVMGITDENFPFCHSISEQIMDKNISTRDWNYRTIYDCFGNPSPVNCVSTALNLPPIPIHDS